MAHQDLGIELVRLGRQGRLVVPAHVRRALRLREGDRLAVEVAGDRLILTSRRAEIERLQGAFKRPPGSPSVVKELLAERREEARREMEA